jgi:uncharacterized protein (TIGR00297 family)
LRNSTPARIVTDVYDLATLAGFGDRLVIERWAIERWTIDRLAIDGVLTLFFAVLARGVRGVTTGGALAGAVSCFILYLGGGPGAFAALVAVFGLAWITTRLGYQRKQKLGIAERREGRNAFQVLANLGIATACAALHILSPDNTVSLLALTAALSEAAADTVSSEVGQAFDEKARLITNWSSVPAGTDGAVSVIGTLAGIAAVGTVSSVCALGGLLPWQWLPISVGAAILGTVVDSFLGAWLERRQLLNNDSVNFLSTLVAALVSALLS